VTAPIVAHSWDPYHGDPNNRYPRLSAPVKRVVAREAWTDFRLTQAAIYNNGIFADHSKLDVHNYLDQTRSAFGQEPEPRST